MIARLRHSWKLTTLLGLVVAASIIGVAIGSVPSQDGTITACVNMGNASNRSLEFVDVDRSNVCDEGQTVFQWPVVGPTGPSGANGAVGATGARGAVGAVGDQGAAGPTGAKGVKGATGNANTTVGPQGDKGPAGAAGTPGAPGQKGPTGPKGPPGPAGGPGPAAIQNAPGVSDGPFSADNVVKYASIAVPITLDKTRTVVVSGTGAFGADNPPQATMDYQVCWGHRNQNDPAFLVPAAPQSISFDAGQQQALSSTLSISLPAGSYEFGFCVRVSAGQVTQGGGGVQVNAIAH